MIKFFSLKLKVLYTLVFDLGFCFLVFLKTFLFGGRLSENINHSYVR